MEYTLQHDERDDQNADREHSFARTKCVILCNKTLSCSCEGDALYLGGGCHILIAQVHQTHNDREIGQKENLRDDSACGTYCSVALVQVLECHVKSDEYHKGKDAGSQGQCLYDYPP